MVIKFDQVHVIEYYEQGYAEKKYTKILIKLTKTPTEEDKKEPGYNPGFASGDIKDELTEYSMIDVVFSEEREKELLEETETTEENPGEVQEMTEEMIEEEEEIVTTEETETTGEIEETGTKGETGMIGEIGTIGEIEMKGETGGKKMKEDLKETEMIETKGITEIKEEIEGKEMKRGSIVPEDMEMTEIKEESTNKMTERIIDIKGEHQKQEEITPHIVTVEIVEKDKTTEDKDRTTVEKEDTNKKVKTVTVEKMIVKNVGIEDHLVEADTATVRIKTDDDEMVNPPTLNTKNRKMQYN